jgi:hypothetical protein
LDGVIGLEDRAEHPVAIAGQLSAVVLEVLRPDIADGVGSDGHSVEA